MGTNPYLLESLERWRNSEVVILGVGNPLRGDDAAGPLLCERISGRVSATILDAGTVPENYIGPILTAQPDALLIVDAVDYGGTPGQIRVFEPDQVTEFAFGTHALSFHLFLDIVGQRRTLEVRLIGVQVAAREVGAALSPAAQQAIETLADTLAALFPGEQSCQQGL